MALKNPATVTEATTGSPDGLAQVQTKSQRRAKRTDQAKSKSNATVDRQRVGRLQKAAGKPAKLGETKASVVLKKLQSPKGVTIAALMEATNWQPHSLRGFLSAVVRKKLGLSLVSETGKDGERRYRIDNSSNTSA